MSREIKIEHLTSKKNIPTVTVNGLLLHSKYDPIVEAERIAQSNYSMHHTIILFGYGLGYLVDELLNKVENEHIVIIDPLIENGFLEICERHKNENKVVYWEAGHTNTLGYTIAGLSDGLELKLKTISSPNYDSLFQKEYYKLLRYLRDFQDKTQINNNTVTFFAEQWQKNLAYNLTSIVQDNSLSILQNKFNVPVVIASGGPSLTKQLPLLKKMEKHVIIIAAGSTINSLLAANIEPDFVVSIDGGEPNYHHFKGLTCENARLIYSTFNHHGIRKSFQKKGYVFTAMEQGSIVKYLHDKFDMEIPMVLGGGTVAHFTYSIAHLLNSGPIAMLGQDLAYTNNQTHAQSNKHAKQVEQLEDLNVELLKVEGYYGEEVLTSRSFNSMKMTFEEIMKFHIPEVPVYNCTEGGLKIRGLSQMAFKEFIDEYVDVNITKDLSILEEESISNKSNEEIVKVLKEEQETLAELQKSLEKAISALEKNKSKTQFKQNTLKKLDKIDKKIDRLSKDVQVHFLVSPITLDIEMKFLEQPNETPEETYIRVFKQSETLYRRLLHAFETSKVLASEVIEKLEEESENKND
ncbi:hypothetical protein BK128_04275 [Viridibacillus sp. FSL H7-0596]|uniref:motility associated factor glycosyltransferase family protein n=1 Tax=Viridibacillus sp. FSL H7-0596 TaxID=1928923 RepID=UPI00096BFC27|nr:6-hydroxymethylpterin diphosphokinase MptE-like protein [Viridibacillus sp. FSL H7-0596]OMC89151.1 hypothetical protein BK128_04275 [Viridibacillus sp. FSL H7-0596]